MGKKILTRPQVIALLKKAQGERPAKELARKIGISEPYLSEIYKGTRDPGNTVLEFLKLEKVPAYVEVTA